MEQTAFTPPERIESLKAGILAASVASLAFVLLLTVNQFVFLPLLPGGWIAPVLIKASLQGLMSIVIATVSGFLFGVTYRYVIRSDTNSQMQSGVVLAFSFVRGLAQIDTGVVITDTILPFVLLAIESWLMFSCCCIVLDQALKRGWVKPLITSPSALSTSLNTSERERD